jgi:hypothetical protein
MNRLSMDAVTMEKARQNLIHIGLIAWRKPIYQVLSLEFSVNQSSTRTVMDKPVCLGDIFKQVLERSLP